MTPPDDVSEREDKNEKKPSGPIVGRCGGCGRFVSDGKITCTPCERSNRRREVTLL